MDRALCERLAAQPDELEALVAALPQAWLDQAQEPHWTVREYVHHVADSCLVWALRVRTLAAEDGAQLRAYDFHLWQRTLAYGQRPVADALGAFRALRQSTLALLHGLPEPAWNHRGHHDKQGELDMFSLLRAQYDDAAGHLDDIRTVIEELSRKA